MFVNSVYDYRMRKPTRAKTQKVTVKLTVEVDAQAWDDLFGSEDVGTYVKSVVNCSAAASEGAIIETKLR